eukprot:TRINITY_DN8737_c0_g1_i2.p1 TRINITY_DN8737_c0_g1~~TRINITY_DN8737_c0_g1_i2.p1  ORF type:complete len:422 (-),score=175.42 TRINITY_DN8737_c0_g1_i2:494-1666(-)
MERRASESDEDRDEAVFVIDDGSPRADERGWKMNSRLFSPLQKDPSEMQGLKRRVGTFYKQQNRLIQSFVVLDEIFHTNDDAEESKRENDELKIKIAIYLTIGINLGILSLQMWNAISSGSMAILAAMLDSLLDLMSGIVIFGTTYLVKRINPYKYPAGRSRLEPLGIVILAAIMGTGMLQVVQTSAQTLASGDIEISLGIQQYVVVAANVALKIGLWIFCWTVKGSPSVDALRDDHRNDIIMNVFGMGFALVGFYVKPLVDPIGGIVISLYIISNWVRTAAEQVRNLTGITASPEFLKQLTYIALNHDERILKIDTVRAFHLGFGFLAEIDVVLPEQMPLKEAHDIGESLQLKIERLAAVERAHVHLDYEYDHEPEHGGKNTIQLEFNE